MSVSDRQLELIKEAAEILIMESRLDKEEAILLISSSIRKELGHRGITLEALNLSTKSERTSFIRAVVSIVKDGIQSNPYWRSKQIDQMIEKFYKVLHDSWQREH